MVETGMNGIKDENTRFLFAATACHSGIFLESLYPSGEFNGWSAKRQRCSLVDREVQVGGLNPLGRCKREVLVHVDKLQGKY